MQDGMHALYRASVIVCHTRLVTTVMSGCWIRFHLAFIPSMSNEHDLETKTMYLYSLNTKT